MKEDPSKIKMNLAILFHRLEMESFNYRLNIRIDSWMGPRGKLSSIPAFIYT